MTGQRHPFQFSLRKLLIWMTVWAVYLGLLRAMKADFVEGLEFTLYLAGIVAIYARWGLAEGCSMTMTMSTVYLTCFIIARSLVYSSAESLTLLGLLTILARIPILLVFGVIPGFVSVYFVHWVANTVNWVDRKIEGKQ